MQRMTSGRDGRHGDALSQPRSPRGKRARGVRCAARDGPGGAWPAGACSPSMVLDAETPPSIHTLGLRAVWRCAVMRSRSPSGLLLSRPAPSLAAPALAAHNGTRRVPRGWRRPRHVEGVLGGYHHVGEEVGYCTAPRSRCTWVGVSAHEPAMSRRRCTLGARCRCCWSRTGCGWRSTCSCRWLTGGPGAPPPEGAGRPPRPIPCGTMACPCRWSIAGGTALAASAPRPPPGLGGHRDGGQARARQADQSAALRTVLLGGVVPQAGVGLSPRCRAAGCSLGPPAGCPRALAATGAPGPCGAGPALAARVDGAAAYTDGSVMDGIDPTLAVVAWTMVFADDGGQVLRFVSGWPRSRRPRGPSCTPCCGSLRGRLDPCPSSSTACTVAMERRRSPGRCTTTPSLMRRTGTCGGAWPRMRHRVRWALAHTPSPAPACRRSIGVSTGSLTPWPKAPPRWCVFGRIGASSARMRY